MACFGGGLRSQSASSVTFQQRSYFTEAKKRRRGRRSSYCSQRVKAHIHKDHFGCNVISCRNANPPNPL